MPEAPKPETNLRRSIGLLGGVALVVGAVIGAGIFVLIAEIAAQAGPAIGVAFALAMLVSLISVFPLIQVSGALPRAGAGYFYSSRLLSPFIGLLASWWIILGGMCLTIVSTLTLGVYVNQYLPFGLPLEMTAILLLLVFYGVYLLGLRVAVAMQVVMMVQFVTALAIYAIKGAASTDLVFALNAPAGTVPLLMAVLLCYSTCLGFQVVAELGEEMREPRRNIPLSLLIGGLITATVYMVVGTVFVSTMRLDAAGYRALEAPLSESAVGFLGPFWLRFLALAAIMAGLTSLNAGATALPREIFAQARDGLLPKALAKVSPRTGAPQHAVTVFLAGVLLWLSLGWALGQDVDYYGYTGAIGILVMSSVICVAALRLPKRYPEELAKAYIRFPQWFMALCTVITILASLGFGAVIIRERPSALYVYALATAAATAYYRLTKRKREP